MDVHFQSALAVRQKITLEEEKRQFPVYNASDGIAKHPTNTTIKNHNSQIVHFAKLEITAETLEMTVCCILIS
jgi:hypothetical protein